MMYLAPNNGPMYRVSSSGGDPRVLFPAGVGESDYHTPSVLPGARAILFTTHNVEGRQTLEVLADGERKVLLKIPGARLEYATWAPPAGSGPTGHLIYHRMNTNTGVWAVPFNLDALEISGEPFILDPDGTFPSVGRDGSLLHAVGSGGGLVQLVIVDRQGQVVSVIGKPQVSIQFPNLSPNGRWVLVSARGGDSRDIWVHDIERGTRTRMTFGSQQDAWQAGWVNDGTDIAFSTGSGQTNVTWLRRADGSGEPEAFVDGFHLSIPDGTTTMAFVRFVPVTGNDIYTRPVDGSAEAQPFLQSEAAERAPQISPDGKYIIYMSDESGGDEIYLKNFPSGSGKWQVSTEGGAWPVWSRNGDEIIYREGFGTSASMITVSVRTTPAVRLGSPVRMFAATDAPELQLGVGFRSWSVTNDPDRFLMLRLEGDARSHAVRLVYSEDWFESYRRSLR